MATPRPLRPRITLPPPATPLYHMPTASTLGVPSRPGTAMPDGPWGPAALRSGFVFKQIRGVKDFTLNVGKSGLSVGEKTAFWLYNKVRKCTFPQNYTARLDALL
jgi:hypothetical protein